MRPVLLLLSLLVVAAVARPARAGKVDDLSKILLEDSSYKVRVQAALVLGKLADRNAVPALARSLRDSNNTVRAVSAQALGRIGAPEAVKELREVLKTEKDPFVRSQISKSLALLETTQGSTGGGSKMYLELGPFSGGAKGIDATTLGIFRTGIEKKLGSLGTVTFALSATEKRGFDKSGRRGFLIDGNITRLDASKVGSALETNCDVKVMVARWPSKSIILWTSAGAAVQGGSRDRDREIARKDCLEASADQVGEDLKKFFESQGG
ncbi:MAG: HEAT repeat domain-containing protein [Deltaproteobacteria bacterium]|nr:HEAT repeat domain-containing protein [Deltaproteobacteria bacterium]